MNRPIYMLALCATYNRRDVTLSALRSLRAQTLPPGATIDIALVDDASTDGTLDAVQNDFPDVSAIGTCGGLFWAGAMRFGFARFWDVDKYTHLLVFNDDAVFYPNAVSVMLATYNSHMGGPAVVEDSGVVIVASFHDGVSMEPTYGGYIRKRGFKPVLLSAVKPTGTPQFADTLNMNLALIDKACLCKHDLIGMHFSHGLADFDFGFRVNRNGVPVIVAPGFQGICFRNSRFGTWEDSSLTFSKRLRHMLSPKGVPIRPRFYFLKAHARLSWPIFLFWPYICFDVCYIHSRLTKRSG